MPALFLAATTYINVPYLSTEIGDFVPPDSAFSAFGMTRTGGAWLATQLKEVKIKINEESIQLNDNLYKAPMSFWKDDVLYMPAEFVSFTLCKVIRGYAYWDREKKRFFVKDDKPTIGNISIDDRGDSVCLTVRYAEGVHLKPQADPTAPSVITLSVPGGFYWKDYRIEGKGPVTSILITHAERGMTIHVSLGEGASGYQLHDRTDLFVLSVYKTRKVKEPEQKKRKLDLIVVDPGHGGKDPGAIGYDSLCEKDITLSVALLLKKELERELGVRVILTREDDRFVTLGDRARIANRAGADLFISLHCNWGKRKEARGTETYFLAAARTDWERSVAAFENKAIEYEGELTDKSDIVGYILSDMIQNEYLKESQDLAAFVHEGIVEETKLENRGVKQAGFYVLRGCYMPSILVEMAFISNKQDAKLLQEKEVQMKIVKGIVVGVKEFKKRYESK
ncbi:MAG: N-acetylmuramoyl-L-alanine amidase [candidate division WOR-3 bacterium]